MLVSSSHLSLKPEVNCRFHFNSNNLIYTNCGPKAINLNIKWELIKIANRPRFRPSKSGSLLSRGLAVFSQCLFGSYFPACRSFWVTTGKRTLLEFSAQQLFQNTEDWADPACPPLLGRLSLSLSSSQAKNHSSQLPLQGGVNGNLHLHRWGTEDTVFSSFSFLPFDNHRSTGLFTNGSVRSLLLFKG